MERPDFKKLREEHLATLPARQAEERRTNASAVAARLRDIAAFLKSEAGQAFSAARWHDRGGLRRYVITEMLHDQQDEKGNASYIAASSIQTFIGQAEIPDGSDVLLERLDRPSVVSGVQKLRRSKRVLAPKLPDSPAAVNEFPTVS